MIGATTLLNPGSEHLLNIKIRGTIKCQLGGVRKKEKRMVVTGTANLSREIEKADTRVPINSNIHKLLKVRHRFNRCYLTYTTQNIANGDHISKLIFYQNHKGKLTS